MILRELADQAATSGGGTPTVLVVDDDATSRLLAGAALKDQLRVVDVENGKLAVEALDRQAFDIAILDLEMPVMDGFAVIERARARPETRYLPIIVVTGREDVVSIERAFALGATSFICKPINWSLFRHQVGYVLHVAQVERGLRAENQRLERLACLRARSMAALEREIEKAATGIDGLPGMSAPALDTVRDAGRRLLRLLHRVGRASDVLTGEADFSPGAVSAQDLAAAALQAVSTAEGYDVAERVGINVPDRLSVLGDAGLVTEALAEILQNALKAAPPGEPVRMRIVDAPPDRVRFEITDRGLGIPEYLLESGIADLTPENVKCDRAPIGLGLLLAKAIVDRHGGHFGIMSEPGSGTDVFLSFPAATEGSVSQTAAHGAAKMAS